MPGASEKYFRYAVSAVFIGLTVFLGYFAKRTDFVPFIAAYGVFFGLYIWLFFFKKNISPAETRWYIGLGIALRVLLLFNLPNFSDDFYRFLWDGRLTVAGIHPFAQPPSYFVENQIFPKGITPELFGKLNSPGYFTVYPPVCQAMFALAAWLSPASEGGSVLAMKLFLLGCEVGTIWLLAPPQPPQGGENVAPPVLENTLGKAALARPLSQVGENVAPLALGDALGDAVLGPPPTPQRGENSFAFGFLQKSQRSDALPPLGGWGGAAYALNPLIILEIMGNCHFEGAMIFFLLAGLQALEQNRVKTAALWWALATAAKLLPLMFLPIVWRWLGWRKGLVFNAVFAGACLVLFAPLLSVLPNILASLDLYFRQFQFNASIYYLLREVGFWHKGWDIGESLGPLLGAATVVGVGVAALMTCTMRFDNFSKVVKSTDKVDLLDALLLALMLQLSLSATVHPWYVTVPFAIGLLTNWRFSIVWSGLVALSYSHYAGGFFQENYWFIALEYIALWLFILWEAGLIASRRSQIVSRRS